MLVEFTLDSDFHNRFVIKFACLVIDVIGDNSSSNSCLNLNSIEALFGSVFRILISGTNSVFGLLSKYTYHIAY